MTQMDSRESREAERAPGRSDDQMRYDMERRWQAIGNPDARRELLSSRARRRAAGYRCNIENYIGTVTVPVGVAGPLRIRGAAGTRDYRVPLATTEAALVASYNRGARLVTAAGGCEARVVAEAVSRTPMFAFASLADAAGFARWAVAGVERWREAAAGVTAHGRLVEVRSLVEGNKVWLDLRYTTGDAAGQNMVTFASEAVCRRLLAESPVEPVHWFLEANLSGDKKASARSLGDVRGRRAVAEVSIPAALVADALHTSPAAMVDYWYAGAIGGVMSGTTGIQGHVANGLAALYLACGQDVACVAESATGITRLDTGPGGDLHATVTLPNVMVGTVGGGTGLPSARACLDILGLAGPGRGNALAEVCAGIALAGELSIIGAFCSGDFAAAHRALSRGDVPARERRDD